MARNKATPKTLAAEIETIDGVCNVVTSWDGADLSVLVENGTDIAPIRRGLEVVNINDFDAAPYVLVELDV